MSNQERLQAEIAPLLERLYPEGGPDPIAAATIARALHEAGFRWISAQRVEAAMWKVPNLVGDVDSADDLAAALLEEPK